MISLGRFNNDSTKNTNEYHLPVDCKPSDYVQHGDHSEQSLHVGSYNLAAVIHHHGDTLQSGHYTASTLRDAEQGWMNWNDSECSTTSITEVTESEFNTRNCYLASYTSIQNDKSLADIQFDQSILNDDNQGVDFRNCSNGAGANKGIDLEARQKYKHWHGSLSDCKFELEESDIKNETILKLYRAQRKFIEYRKLKIIMTLRGTH